MLIVPQQASLFDGKICPRCKQHCYPHEFYKNRSARDGLNGYCKPCWKVLSNASAEKHRERKRKQDREYMACRRAEDPQKAKDEYREWYGRRGLDYSRQWRAENLERVRANKRQWRRANPEKALHEMLSRLSHRRGAGGSHTLEEWQALCARYGGRCLWCGRECRLSRDHIVPISQGGSDFISNIQPLCRSCNSRKGARHQNFRPDRLLE